MTKQEFLMNECWGLITWPIGAMLSFYNGAMVAAFICTFFSGVAIGLACRNISNIRKEERDLT